jgi:hypothetical protein
MISRMLREHIAIQPSRQDPASKLKDLMDATALPLKVETDLSLAHNGDSMKLSPVIAIADKPKEVVIAWSYDSDCGGISKSG